MQWALTQCYWIASTIVAQMVKNLPAMRESLDSVQDWVGKILWRRQWLPTPVFLPGKATVHGIKRVRHNWETNTHIHTHKCGWFRRFSKPAAVAATLVAMWMPLGASCTSSTGSTKTKNKQLKNHWSCNFWKTFHFWPVLTYIQRTSLTAFVTIFHSAFGCDHLMKACLPLF